jgi:hypothetical protein
MDTQSIQKLLAQASKLEVVTTTVRMHSQPQQFDNTYTGDLKFTKAFAEVISTNDNNITHIYVTETIGTWNYRHTITHTDFIKCFAFEVLNKSLSKFTSVMFRYANGFESDSSEAIKTAEAEVYNAHEDGERYWKNLVAQESAVAEAKAKAEALAKEILNAKTKSEHAEPFDDFGSGNPTV